MKNVKNDSNSFATSREAILHSAQREFARRGYDGASLAKIAAAANTNHSLVIYHFKNKELLWREVIEYIFGNMKERLSVVESLTKDIDSLSALKIFIRAFVEFSAKQPDRIALVLNEIRGDTKRLDWIVENHIGPLHALFDRLVARAVEDGMVKPIPPVHMAHMVIGSASTFFVSRPMIQKVYGLDTMSPEVINAHADWVIEALIGGLAATRTTPDSSNQIPSELEWTSPALMGSDRAS